MEEIAELTHDLASQCRRALSHGGRLTTAIAGYAARHEQIEMAEAVAHAIEAKSILVVEAGTGTGKTFAYLVPALFSGKKIIVSTATKTLQDQLYNKDLPLLIRALGLSVRTQNLKGRANYLCKYRTHLHAEEGRFLTKQCTHDVLHVRERLGQLTHGERSELPELNEDAEAWPFVTSTVENCQGSECAYYSECFLVKARKKAMAADVVVINHHLFFADSRLKEEGFGELLPGVDLVVFDEAHQLAEIATHFNGERFSTKQLSALFDDLIREWPVLDLANRSFKMQRVELEHLTDTLVSSLAQKEERVTWQEACANLRFKAAWQALLAFVTTLIEEAEAAKPSDAQSLTRAITELKAYRTLAEQFERTQKSHIAWIERYKRSLLLHATPLSVADSFMALLKKQSCAYVFTSATLTMASSFACFLKPLGLEHSQTLSLQSPFDFKKQALLYLPRGMPDPKHPRYYDALLDNALPLINACGGRCFFLFTSHRALKKVAEALNNQLQYPLLVQGDEAKPILLARFRELGNAVLLGTATFWEGVDVKGEALSCVVIDKLPFASPVDPVTRGKMAYFKQQGLSGFDELSLPNAVLALKQGVGRLIRDSADKGVLMIADPRLTGREYGRQVFNSLPPLHKTRDFRTVLHFIQTVMNPHESVSH